MNENAEMLDLLKALAHADRLKIIGMLVQNPATLSQVAAGLPLPTRDAYNHLAFLEYVGLVSESEGVYHLQTDQLEKYSRRHLEGQRPEFTPPIAMGPGQKKVLVAFLNPDGTIRKIPNSITQSARFRLVLDYIQAAFEPGRIYNEKEVNAVISRFHHDFAGLRRDLVDAGLLARERDGSKYWRVEQEGGK